MTMIALLMTLKDMILAILNHQSTMCMMIPRNGIRRFLYYVWNSLILENIHIGRVIMQLHMVMIYGMKLGATVNY